MDGGGLLTLHWSNDLTPAERNVLEDVSRLHHWPLSKDRSPRELFFADGRLQYRDARLGRISPLVVDFQGGKLGHRRRFGKIGKNQLLGRALGLKDSKPFVIDATAGLAADAFTLLCLGCRVRALERSPVLVALIQDAHRRACTDVELAPVFEERFEILLTDAVVYLETLRGNERPDSVYLDPMFPQKKKTALSGREMQYLQSLAEEMPTSASSEEDLVAAALRAARSRVVIKRPLKAPPLWKPVVKAFSGTTVRYDMYLTSDKDSTGGNSG